MSGLWLKVGTIECSLKARDWYKCVLITELVSTYGCGLSAAQGCEGVIKGKHAILTVDGNDS